MVNADTARLNLQLQNSIVNDRIANQLFNFSIRYNFGGEKTRVTPLFSVEDNYRFEELVIRAGLEFQQKLGIFTPATMIGWNFDEGNLLYQFGLNARVTRKFGFQTAYGNYRLEIFGAEKAWENGLVVSSAPLTLRFYNLVPAGNGRLEFKYSRFITSFLITILNKS